MNVHTERQPRTPRAVNRLVSLLATFDHLMANVLAAPTVGRDRRVASGEPAGIPPASSLDDDLANATWEDAEWQ